MDFISMNDKLVSNLIMADFILTYSFFRIYNSVSQICQRRQTGQDLGGRIR